MESYFLISKLWEIFDKILEKLIKFTLKFKKSNFSQIIYQKIIKFCTPKKKHYSYSNSQHSSYNPSLLRGVHHGDFEMFGLGIQE
jgi:hypothetical protein